MCILVCVYICIVSIMYTSILVFILFIVNTISFYTPLRCVLERHIVASFPHIPIHKAVDLLHNPEHWGRGACMVFGVPRFKITNVSQVMRFNHDKMMRFYSNGITPITLVSNSKYHTKVVIGSSTVICLKLRELNKGFSLNLESRGLFTASDNETDVENTRRWVELALFMFNKNVSRHSTHPSFVEWSRFTHV